jgi:hypothetical protein
MPPPVALSSNFANGNVMNRSWAFSNPVKTRKWSTRARILESIASHDSSTKQQPGKLENHGSHSINATAMVRTYSSLASQSEYK